MPSNPLNAAIKIVKINQVYKINEVRQLNRKYFTINEENALSPLLRILSWLVFVNKFDITYIVQ